MPDNTPAAIRRLIEELGLDSQTPPPAQLDEFTKMLLKKGLESVMESEMTEHLGYDKNDREAKTSRNKRNGHLRKKL